MIQSTDIGTGISTGMMIDKDKQNSIKNSKLQMSIKPFTIAREDLSKSKSVDKAKKGISRVKNGELVYNNNHNNNASSRNLLTVGTATGYGQVNTGQQREGNALIPLSHKIHASQVYQANSNQVRTDNFVNSATNMNRIRVQQFSTQTAMNNINVTNTISNKIASNFQTSSSSSYNNNNNFQSHNISPTITLPIPHIQLQPHYSVNNNNTTTYHHPRPVPYSNPPPLPASSSPSQYDHHQHNNNNGKNMEIFDLNCKIQLLEKQLTILQKENMEIRQENNIWKQKCVQLEQKERNWHINNNASDTQRYNRERQQLQLQKYRNRDQQKQTQITKLHIHIKQLTQQNQKDTRKYDQQYNILKQSIKDKQQQLRQKDRRIVQLQQIINKNTNEIQYQSNNKIRQLTLQLQNETNRCIELQQQLKTIKINQQQQSSLYSPQQSLNKLQQSLSTAQHRNTELQQQYRLILYKNSTLVSQKIQIQQKYQQVQQQNIENQRRYAKLVEQYKIIQGNFMELERQAILGRACRKQIQQLDVITQQNITLKQKIKQQQTRRISQTQQHKQQLKRVTKQQQQKSQQYLQYKLRYQQQLQKQLQQLKIQYNEKVIKISTMEVQFKREKQMLVESISRDYEAIVLQLKQEVVQLKKQKQRQNQKQRQRNIRDGEDKDVIKDKDKQIQQLRKKLIQFKQDNSFLMQKIQQYKQKQATAKIQLKQKQKPAQKHRSRSPSPPHNPLLPSQNTKLQQFQSQISSLQNYNKKLNQKIASFQLQYVKMQDKLHLLQLQSQKTRTKQQSNDRKIKHLLDQIQHFTTQKQKLISQKISITEELQNIRINYKNKENQCAKIVGEFKCVSQNYGKLEIEKKDIIEVFNKKINILELELSKKNNQYAESQITIAQFKKQIQYKDKQLGSLKQLVKLTQQQLSVLHHQKQKQYMSTKTQSHQNYLVRVGLYRQYLIWLGNKSNNSLINTDLSSSKQNQQMDLLRQFSKMLRQFVDQKNILQQKYIRLELQSKQNQQIQASTRILVHKYQQKCLELQALLIKMEQMHNQKLVLVKSDYDVLYAKYLKYRNMAIAQNKEKSKEKGIRKNII